MTTSADGRTIHFSTAHLPERDRIAIWREVLGRSVLRLDIEPLPEVPFFAEVKLQTSAGFAIASLAASGTRERRTRELVADGNDVYGLALNLSGPFVASHRGRDATLGRGDALLVSSAETGTFTRPILGRSMALAVPRAALTALVPNADDGLGKLIPANREALKLLTAYLGTMKDVDTSTSPALQRAVANHICDLVALAIGASGDAAEFACGRGARAARLAAIKTDIDRSLGNRGLAVSDIALRHGVTPRQVQRLFEAEGSTFSEYLLDRRLDAARRMLGDPRRGSTISAIAFDVGFGDLSYFNRTFRRRYGAAPSEIRAACRETIRP